MSKKNQVIDHIIGLLGSLKEKEVRKVALSSGNIKLTAVIDSSEKRVSIVSQPGQTELQFDARKIDTIEGMGHIFLEAAKLARETT